MVDVDLSENNGNELVITATFLLVVTYIAAGLRCYVRAVLKKNFQASDWLILVALGIFTVMCAFILAGVKTGLGKHNAAIDEDDAIKPLKVWTLSLASVQNNTGITTNTQQWQALATAAYVLDMMFVKLSIAMFLLRLNQVNRGYRIILIVSMVVVAIWSTVSFFWDLFHCRPIQALWEYNFSDDACAAPDQIVNFAYAFSAMSIATDWLYALLPIPMVWHVKMSRPAKTTVVIVLGMGAFASVATLIRLKFLKDLENLEDILYIGTEAMIWTIVEPGVALTAACLITIRPLLQAMRIRGFASQDVDASGSAGSGARTANPGLRPGELTLIDMETGDHELEVSDIPQKAHVCRSSADSRASSTSVSGNIV